MAISGAIKALAKELNVPIIVLSQLSRASEGRSENKPKLSDLRDSGAIEQDADIVMLLYRSKYYEPESNEDKAILDIAKYRHGSTGPISLRLLISIQDLKIIHLKKKIIHQVVIMRLIMIKKIIFFSLVLLSFLQLAFSDFVKEIRVVDIKQ